MAESSSADRTASEGVKPPDAPRAVRIVTGARLHFGLLDTVAPFGGVGLMIDAPQTEIIATPADTFRCDQPIMQRAEAIADRICQFAGLRERPKCQIKARRRAQPHCGLGSGTQLALAIAECMCHSIGLTVPPSALAIQIAARGRRSAVGVHGYFGGGLIFETASENRDLNRIQSRAEVPDQWRVAVFRPADDFQPVSGDREQQQFANLPQATEHQRRLLTELGQQLVAAANQQQFSNFADGVQRYNLHSGLLFQTVQGGPYNGHAIASLVDLLCQRGAVGVGQSSWGPGVFAWFKSANDAEHFASRLPAGVETITIARPLNDGRRLELI